MKSLLFYTLLFLCISSNAQVPSPRQLTIASFNMAWAGTVEDYEAHQKVCRTVNWCDTRPAGRPPTQEAIEVAKQCAQATERAAGGQLAAQKIAPCNAYKTKGNPQKDTVDNYRVKLQHLQGTVERLIEKEDVKVLAFQEVKSSAVVKHVLGKFAGNFDTCDAPHNAFQTVAFAWDKQLASVPGICQVNQNLAVMENPNDTASQRKVRPGLALTLILNGEPLTLMNVHLKSGCASVNSGDSFPPRILTDKDSACRVLNRQVPHLESWLEAVYAQSKDLILLGDFNRKINDEEKKQIHPHQVRTDASDPAGPNRTDDDGYVKTKYLWPEIADGSPHLVQIEQVRGATSCKGFEGLDHIVMSKELYNRQRGQSVTSRQISVNRTKGQKIDTSDHCPTILKLFYGMHRN